MPLRDYQTTAVDRVFEEWLTHNSTLVVMATGLGKTALIAEVAKRLSPKRTMVIAHREELIFQAKDEIEFWGGLDCDIEKAELVGSTSFWNKSRVVVASVQTLISGKERKRMERFNPNDFGALICDECHHGVSDSYLSIFSYFKQNERLKILGVTATPKRFDEEALGQVFKSVASKYRIIDGIEDGWLVPIKQRVIKTEVDFSEVRTTAGDLNGADLAAVMESEGPSHGIAKATLDEAGDRRTILFASSVKHAETMCNVLNRYKPGCAEWVCGKTRKDKRRDMLQRFKTGDIQIMVNCGVLTEGYNNAWVEVISMGRPTKSESLYQQMGGRGTRPLPGVVDRHATASARKLAIQLSAKPNLLIIDFTGNSGKHKLMTAGNMLGGKVSDRALEKAIVRAEKEGKPALLSKVLEEEEAKLQKELERRRIAEEARKAKVVAKVTYRVSEIDPFNAFDLQPSVNGHQPNGKVLSPAQRNILAQQGIDANKYSYSDGLKLFLEIRKRWSERKASFPQLSTLTKWCGVIGLKKEDINPNLSKVDASRMLDQISLKQGWKRK